VSFQDITLFLYVAIHHLYFCPCNETMWLMKWYIISKYKLIHVNIFCTYVSLLPSLFMQPPPRSASSSASLLLSSLALLCYMSTLFFCFCFFLLLLLLLFCCCCCCTGHSADLVKSNGCMPPKRKNVAKSTMTFDILYSHTSSLATLREIYPRHHPFYVRSSCLTILVVLVT